jgi:hypothetical protein
MPERPANVVCESDLLTADQIAALDARLAQERKRFDKGPYMPYGKFKGCHAAECPLDYLKWLAGLETLRNGFRRQLLAHIKDREACEAVGAKGHAPAACLPAAPIAMPPEPYKDDYLLPGMVDGTE